MISTCVCLCNKLCCCFSSYQLSVLSCCFFLGLSALTSPTVAMSHQSVLARLDQKRFVSITKSVTSSIVQWHLHQTGIFRRPTVTVKTESESPPNQHHNIMQSIKVKVKEEEHFDEQDCPECVVKREFDFDEGEQMETERPMKREQTERMNGGDANDDQVNEKIKVIHLNCNSRMKVQDHQHYKHSPERFECLRAGCCSSFATKSDLARHELTHLNTRPFHCTWPHCSHSAKERANLLKHIRTQHFGLPKSVKEQMEKKIEDDRDPNEYVRVVVEGDE